MIFINPIFKIHFFNCGNPELQQLKLINNQTYKGKFSSSTKTILITLSYLKCLPWWFYYIRAFITIQHFCDVFKPQKTKAERKRDVWIRNSIIHPWGSHRFSSSLILVKAEITPERRSTISAYAIRIVFWDLKAAVQGSFIEVSISYSEASGCGCWVLGSLHHSLALFTFQKLVVFKNALIPWNSMGTIWECQ